MRKEISRRGWLAIGAGVVLGMGGAVVAGQVTDQANAQSSAHASGVTLSAGQLLINQRISQAAVRRSNESLQMLDPIRANPNKPTKVLGWRTNDLLDAAVTTAKLADAAVTSAKLAPNAVTATQLSPELREGQARWAVVNGDTGERIRQHGATASKYIAPGQYSVTWDRDISACSVQTSVAATTTTAPPVGRTITAWVDPTDAKTLLVRTVEPQLDTTATPNTLNQKDVNTPFHVAVLC